MNLKTVLTSIFKTLAFLLVLAVLLPSAVKLSHVFTHHTHKVCENDQSLDTHFHEADVECNFYKFKLTNNLFLVINNYELASTKTAVTQLPSYYTSLKNYHYLISFVRGPPAVS
ncbi:hypothetical protein [Winogradskyella psychrotolerans]|uniref:hypothetical protein n=1 Tax=Winogradskyella psychrotolerans TaxID=1344585 RepID=UPI001C07BE67|nr:hypothetical protein [Winogradskyella psychrotolerans]MBU2928905.1 hypothetical protein [Winogradskyella psychrotolerans]